MRRVTCSELLDDDGGTPREVKDSLDDIWRVNRWLGGLSNSLQLLRTFLAHAGAHRVRILDVGDEDCQTKVWPEHKEAASRKPGTSGGEYLPNRTAEVKSKKHFRAWVVHPEKAHGPMGRR